MKKEILMPVLAILLAAAVLFAASAGLSSIREENALRELEEMMKTILPGSSAFTEELYSGEDENIRAAYKAENGYVVHVVTAGYAGDISMLVGVYNDGSVAGLVVRELRETRGLGGRALTDTGFLSQFNPCIGFQHRIHDIVLQPGSQSNMPTLPEFLDGCGKEWITEILRQNNSEAFRGSQNNIHATRKIRI